MELNSNPISVLISFLLILFVFGDVSQVRSLETSIRSDGLEPVVLSQHTVGDYHHYQVGYAEPSSRISDSEKSVLDDLLAKTLVPFYFRDAFDSISKLQSDDPTYSLEEHLFIGVSPTCTAHSMEWTHQIFNSSKLSEAESWALHMTDAWAKPPEGLLSGHTNALGDYDECVGIHARNITFTYPNAPLSTSGTDRSFRGKYCASFVYPKNYAGFEIDNEKILDLLVKMEQQEQNEGKSNRTGLNSVVVRESVPIHELKELMFDLNGPWLLPSFGACFPSSCSVADTKAFVDNVLRLLKLRDEIDFLTFDCFERHETGWTIGEKVMLLIVTSFLVKFCILATLVDCTQVRVLNVTKNKLREAFLAFSLRKSLNKWTNTQKSECEQEYGTGCIHGLAFLSIAWIVLTNTWKIPLFGYHPVWNTVDMKKIYKHWLTLLITNGNVAIDTLFTLSGFLVAIRMFKLLDKHLGKVNLLVFYVRKLIRFLPSYALVIGSIATVYPYLATGPYSGYLDRAAQNCKSNWWTNLLFVNNFANATFENMCITDSWYFANQAQFIFFTPFILFQVWKWPKFGLSILALVIFGSILAPGILTFQHELIPTGIPTREFHLYFQEIYIKPWIRASPFLVGLFCGYLIYYMKKSTHIPRVINAGGWALSTISALAIIFGILPYYDPHQQMPVVQASIYAALHRFAWGIIIGWIIFVCSRGYGGPVNHLLCWSPFKPLSRLTMSAYLVALPVQMILHLRFRQSITHDAYTMVNFYFADLIMVLGVAFLLTILLELPCHELAKLVFHKQPFVEETSKPSRPRFGVYYDKEVSISVYHNSQERKHPFDIAVDMTRPVRRRYGIFYDDTVSDNCSANARSLT